MAIHHIIPKHEWRVRFGNLDGVDAPDNLSPDLYNEQHAQVHKHYYNEITHMEYDRIAGLALAGTIGGEEAHKLACGTKEARTKMSNSHIGKKRLPFTTEHVANMSAAQIGKRMSVESRNKNSIAKIGNNYALGRKHTEEAKVKMLGRKHTEEAKARMSLAARNRKRES